MMKAFVYELGKQEAFKIFKREQFDSSVRYEYVAGPAAAGLNIKAEQALSAGQGTARMGFLAAPSPRFPQPPSQQNV